MTNKLVGLVIAKKDSKRLPHKNIKDFHEKEMFMVNLEKCIEIFDETYFSSDDDEMLRMAKRIGAIPVWRDNVLAGNTPNIPVYQHAFQFMSEPAGIVAVQANSPTVTERTIKTVKNLLASGYDEVMTCHPIFDDQDYHGRGARIYGSVWGISAKRLKRYPNPYKPMPEVLVVDNSIDIHTQEDYDEAIKQKL